MKKLLGVTVLVICLLLGLTACSDKEIDAVLSDIEEAAKDVDINIGDFEVKNFMSTYFKAICNIDDMETSYLYISDEFFDIHSTLITYLTMPYYLSSDDAYAPLSEAIQNFSHKVSDVTYPDENTAKVTVKIENVDVYKIAENVLQEQSRDELIDGGLNKFLKKELEKKRPVLSVSVVFDLQKENGSWSICKVDNEDNLVCGISGNMKKLTDALSESEIDESVARHEYQESLNKEYEKMFGSEESSSDQGNDFDEDEDDWDDTDYTDGDEYDNAYYDYILPFSDCEYLDESDLEDLSAEECRIARNEIYARHGRIFEDEELTSYFNSKDWYEGNIRGENFQEDVFNNYERHNLIVITEYEKMMGY